MLDLLFAAPITTRPVPPEPTVQAAGLLPGERVEKPSRAARSASVATDPHRVGRPTYSDRPIRIHRTSQVGRYV